MRSTALRQLHRLSRRLGVRVALVASLALVAILAAKLLGGVIPLGLSDVIGADALNRLLDIIAASMLAVTTFSLSVWVSVRQATTQALTPRAHRTLMEDTGTQTVLATFVGAWMYALAAIVLLSTPFFGEAEVVMLYLATILVLALIVVAVLRWALHLQSVGSLTDTAQRMEDDAVRALRERPQLAMQVLAGEAPGDEGDPVAAPATGYVQAVDEDELQRIAERAGGRITLLAPPGRFVHAGETIARIAGADGDVAAKVQAAIRVGALRHVEQDPGFGVIQLSEIGSKALSPGINDPGTAIDVVNRIARVLEAWEDPGGRPRCDRLWMPPLEPDALVTDGFDAIARDGAAFVEVQIAIQERLASLARHGPAALREPARAAGRRAYARARDAMAFAPDRARLDAAAPPWVRG